MAILLIAMAAILATTSITFVYSACVISSRINRQYDRIDSIIDRMEGQFK